MMNALINIINDSDKRLIYWSQLITSIKEDISEKEIKEGIETENGRKDRKKEDKGQRKNTDKNNEQKQIAKESKISAKKSTNIVKRIKVS